MDRRAFMVAGGAIFAAAPLIAATRKIGVSPPEPLEAAIARIEAESGGRLGVAVHDTGGGLRFAHRGDERFPMCSTFKLLVAGAVLSRVDRAQEQLDRRMAVRKGDPVGHAPFTAKRVGGQASVAEL